MKNFKILVVEDDVFISHEIKQILEMEGYTVLIDCFTVDMAIEMIDVHQPDLVLLDINLNEKKNGLDLALYLTRIKIIPYIFITSYSDKDTLGRVASLVPSGFITKPFKPQDVISAVYLVAVKCFKGSLTKDSTEKVVPFQITQALDFIQDNIKEKISLETLSAYTSWDREHFGKLFKYHTGLTPYQYILKTRVDLSKKLLEQNNDSIEKICFDLGFSSYSNFYNAFKKYAGVSPDEYRKIFLT
jgi:YesN/AraC family two-component response regulator